ncbi:hypothetical protein [Bradyrhizobium zhanjiangense]|uniref:Uncharacterized protein n=1 Tax=Bradyrhizobium zhanjiangense TaxID=1325107 RepID=A0A4Q0Q8F7_9BRAD|nr:hypothetical protein [Bradyrhizobium zhanjiangense]RXG85344.1 hypothetical protein EAS61_36450 [Bradyrhizobium zhanjiangense]
MSDDENSIDIARRMSRNWVGEERSLDGMRDEFKLYGHGRRAGMLDELDAEFNKMSVDRDNLKRFAEFSTFRRDLHKLHQDLRKAGR